MLPNAAALLPARSLAALVVGLSLLFGALAAKAADTAKRSFDLPAGDAADSLKRYAVQANREIIFPSDPLKGVRTNALKGEYTPRDALDHLVANTGLTVVEDSASGALMITYKYATLQTRSETEPLRPESPDLPPTTTSNQAPMKQNPTKSRLAAAAAILGLGMQSILAADNSTPTSSGAATPENTVKLDPFNVSAESDVGFVAANSLAGGRMTTALKDTPVAYSVLTSEFLEAFNINDAAKASEFSVNTNQNYNDGLQYFQGNTQVTIRIRGQVANTPTQNFFPYNIAADSYNVDRIDFARGANASLFGAGGSAGTQNTVTKQALTSKTVREVRAQVGSWHRYRLSADVSQPLNEKIAVRANALWASGDTWRQNEWEDRKGITLAATYNITPKLSLRAAAEYRTTNKATGTNHTRDNLSAWDGAFTPSGINLSTTAAQMAAAGVTRTAQKFVPDVDNPGTVYNILNRFQTKGAAYNATATNFLGGQPIRTVGFSLNNVDMTKVWVKWTPSIGQLGRES